MLKDGKYVRRSCSRTVVSIIKTWTREKTDSRRKHKKNTCRKLACLQRLLTIFFDHPKWFGNVPDIDSMHKPLYKELMTGALIILENPLAVVD